MGIELNSEAELNAAFGRFKELADRKTAIYDEDLHSLVFSESAEINGESELFHFISVAQRSETRGRPHARIRFVLNGAEVAGEADGNGPVDAVFNAIETQVNSGAELLLYSVNAITAGTQAQGEVTVRLSRNGRIVNGVGTDLDIIAASAKAYLAALSKLHIRGQQTGDKTENGALKLEDC